MRHRIQIQTRGSPAGISPRRRKPPRRKALCNEQNNSERFPDDPVLKIKNAKPGEDKQAEKRQQLIAPLHEADVGAPPLPCQRKNRLSIFSIVAKVRPIWLVRSCSSFATAGPSIPGVRLSAKKAERQPSWPEHRFT